MRIPLWLAWGLLLATFFTAGLLRHFHDHTPRSPYVSPAVGSMLFAGIFFLLLVAAWEWRRGAVPGRGMRLGSLTPILLMLLFEKWISLTLYNPVFWWVSDSSAPATELDAQFRAFAGVGLLLVCLLVAQFSRPTARKVWRRTRPLRFPPAVLGMVGVVGGTYALLGGLAWMLGGGLRLSWPELTPLMIWILGGQAILGFAEEVYYRGLLLSEMERLAPRLGAGSAMSRRWMALLTTSALFGMEHLPPGTSSIEALRQMIFTVSLALLFGLLVMVAANLHFTGGIHAWVNWLLLGAAPRFVDRSGDPALPAGVYIGLTLILSFVLAYVIQRLRRRHLRLRRS